MAVPAVNCSTTVEAADLDPKYTYFSVFYPGLGAGGFVCETGIEKAAIFPHPSHSTGARSLNDDDVFSVTNILVVRFNIRELYEAARTTQSAAYSVHKSILDAEAIAKRKGASHHPGLSFRCVFYLHRDDAELMNRLFYVRWYLLSKMHEWRPGTGLGGNIGCLVTLIDLALMGVYNTERGHVEDDWEARLAVLLKDPGFPLQIMSEQELCDRFWNVEPLSSNSSIRQHLYRVRNYHGDEDALMMRISAASDDADTDHADSDHADSDGESSKSAANRSSSDSLGSSRPASPDQSSAPSKAPDAASVQATVEGSDFQDT